MIHGISKNFLAAGVIAHRLLVKFDGNGDIVAASAATDAIIGVLNCPGGVTSGQRADVDLFGITEVRAGGNISAGGPVTSNGDGEAVASAPAAGTRASIIGRALAAAADGDLIPIVLMPGFNTTPA